MLSHNKIWIEFVSVLYSIGQLVSAIQYEGQKPIRMEKQGRLLPYTFFYDRGNCSAGFSLTDL